MEDFFLVIYKSEMVASIPDWTTACGLRGLINKSVSVIWSVSCLFADNFQRKKAVWHTIGTLFKLHQRACNQTPGKIIHPFYDWQAGIIFSLTARGKNRLSLNRLVPLINNEILNTGFEKNTPYHPDCLFCSACRVYPCIRHEQLSCTWRYPTPTCTWSG